MTTAVLLRDAEASLQLAARGGDFSALEAAFIAWLGGASPAPEDASLTSPLRSYELVAGAAVAEAAGWTTDPARLDDGLRWMTDVPLERTGMPTPVVTDGLAQVALGLAARHRPWFAGWLDRVIALDPTSVTPAWLAGAAGAARGRSESCAPEVRLALAARGVVEATGTSAEAEALLRRLLCGEVPQDPFRAHVILAALAWLRHSAPVVLPGRATPEAVADLLRALPRALQQWPWEDKGRTKNSPARKWHVDHEYHLQAILWAVLAPIFPDLEREPYLPQVGPTQPRVDFSIPSLRLLIEAKFARTRGALKDTVNQIGEDASTYFATPGAFDKLLVFIWDNERNAQDHDLVVGGIRRFARVLDAVVVSRPGHMRESVPAQDGDLSEPAEAQAAPSGPAD